MIPWTVETFFTTLLCVIEIWGWDDRSEAIKWGLTGCYGPYLLICKSALHGFCDGRDLVTDGSTVAAALFVVMYTRVKEALVWQRQHQSTVKEQ